MSSAVKRSPTRSCGVGSARARRSAWTGAAGAVVGTSCAWASAGPIRQRTTVRQTRIRAFLRERAAELGKPAARPGASSSRRIARFQPRLPVYLKRLSGLMRTRLAAGWHHAVHAGIDHHLPVVVVGVV